MTLSEVIQHFILRSNGSKCKQLML